MNIELSSDSIVYPRYTNSPCTHKVEIFFSLLTFWFLKLYLCYHNFPASHPCPDHLLLKLCLGDSKLTEKDVATLTSATLGKQMMKGKTSIPGACLTEIFTQSEKQRKQKWPCGKRTKILLSPATRYSQLQAVSHHSTQQDKKKQLHALPHAALAGHDFYYLEQQWSRLTSTWPPRSTFKIIVINHVLTLLAYRRSSMRSHNTCMYFRSIVNVLES